MKESESLSEKQEQSPEDVDVIGALEIKLQELIQLRDGKIIEYQMSHSKNRKNEIRGHLRKINEAKKKVHDMLMTARKIEENEKRRAISAIKKADKQKSA